MSKIINKFLADNAVDASKIADSSIETAKIADDAVSLAKIQLDSDPTLDTDAARKKYVDDQIAAISLPTVFNLQGNYNASTNTPALANTDTGVDNFLYYVNVAGSQDFGAGSITFSVGDWVYYVNGAWEKADNNDDVLSVNGQTGAVSLNTDDITEGTNEYHTTARARAAAVADSITDGVTDVAPSQNAVFDALALKADDVNVVKLAGSTMDSAASITFAGGGEVLGLPATPSATGAASKEYVDAQIAASSGSTQGREVLTLVAGDITNGYVDLAQEALADSVMVTPAGGPLQEPGVDYTESVPAAVTRITFAGDLAAELVAGDKLIIQYEY